MGVGIYLNGRYSAEAPGSIDGWLRDVARWFDEDVIADSFWGNFHIVSRIGTTYDARPALFVSIYPASEEVEFIVPEAGRVIVSAKTSTAGPGYHTALCRLVRWFGESMKIHWNPAGEGDSDSYDETGYFFTDNRDAVEREMLRQIQAMAGKTLELEPGMLQMWNMPISRGFSKYPGELQTPVGIRSRTWVEAVADDPRKGRDLYPWWDEGTTGSFYLGRALCEMWSKIRWTTILTGDEYDDWDWVCSDLCRAYEKDPHLDFPWREWAQLVDLLNDFEGATDVDEEMEETIREHAKSISEDVPLIGYRRFPIDFQLIGGWSVEIPGNMTEEWKEDTWSAWDGSRTIWFTCWNVRQQDQSAIPAETILAAISKGESATQSFQKENLFGIAFQKEIQEDGKPLLNLSAYVVVDGKYALFNFFLTDFADIDWAVKTWRSAKWTAPAEPAADEFSP